MLCVRTSEYTRFQLWTNIHYLWTHMQIWWHSCRNTQCSSATQQTGRWEISNSNHLGFQQLSSDERAKPWAEIPSSPHSHSQVGEIIGTVFLTCLHRNIVACCWMHRLYVLPTQTRIILPVLNSGFSAYLHELMFVSLITCVGEKKGGSLKNAAGDGNYWCC